MRHTFDSVLNAGADVTGWTESEKLSLLLTYLDSHCSDMIEHFMMFTDAVIDSEVDETEDEVKDLIVS